MKFKEILRKEAELQGEKEIEVDEYGVVRFWINDQHLLHLRGSPDDHFFYLYAKICPLPPLAQDKIYEILLEANLFGEETGQAFFAIHLSSQSIVLMRTFESDTTTFDHYMHEFQVFVDYLVFWKKKMKDMLLDLDKSQENVLNLMSKRHQKIVFI